jgi:hypothetical protein
MVKPNWPSAIAVVGLLAGSVSGQFKPANRNSNPDENLVGWFTDDQCSSAGTSKGHEQCADKCWRQGHGMPFVEDRHPTHVFRVDNPERLTERKQLHLTIVATVNRQAETLSIRGWFNPESNAFVMPDENAAPARAEVASGATQSQGTPEGSITDVNKLLAQATQMSQAGNHEGAVQILKQATQQLPQNDLLWARLGDLELLAGNTSTDRTKAKKFYQDAITHYKKAIEILPTVDRYSKSLREDRYFNGLRDARARLGDSEAAGSQNGSRSTHSENSVTEQSTSSQSTTAGAQPTLPGPFADFTSENILRDIKPRLGNCGGKVNVTDVRVLDKLPSAGIAEIEITANWVAPYNVWATPMDCLGFSQSGGNNQKIRKKVKYVKWESGWKFESISLF